MRRIALVIACALSLSACGTLGPRPDEVGARANPPPLTLAQNHGAQSNRELAYMLIAQSDIRCENYLVGLSVMNNSTDAGLSITAQTLSTVGGLASQGQAANVFSSLSSLVQGGNRTLKDTVFSGRDFQVVYAAVKQGRARLRKDLTDAIDKAAWMAPASPPQSPPSLEPQRVLAMVTPYDLNCGISFAMSELSRAVLLQQ
ncbi:hypothetical protein ACFPIF_16925 [Brevundimonas faecalis]|uniref:hypothetical protein n=1 Tax=Brevundimonas faecalis TaxID=947378 RepID=UPI00360713CE